MNLVLTDKPSGRKIVVNSAHVRLWEVADGGEGTHVVYGAEMGRVVIEGVEQIMKTLGATAPEL